MLGRRNAGSSSVLTPLKVLHFLLFLLQFFLLSHFSGLAQKHLPSLHTRARDPSHSSGVTSEMGGGVGPPNLAQILLLPSGRPHP